MTPLYVSEMKENKPPLVGKSSINVICCIDTIEELIKYLGFNKT